MKTYDPFVGMARYTDDGHRPVVIHYPTADELVGRFRMSPEQAEIVVARQDQTSRRTGTRTAGS
jgi:hypothetical protein